MYESMYVGMYVSMYLCMYTCMYLCMYTCMYLCMYTCMYLCMYTWIFVCMYRGAFLELTDSDSDSEYFVREDIYAHTHTYMYTYIDAYRHQYIHTHILKYSSASHRQPHCCCINSYADDVKLRNIPVCMYVCMNTPLLRIVSPSAVALIHMLTMRS